MDQAKKMAEIFIDENSFTIPVCFRIMVNEHEAKDLYSNMMSHLELYVVIPSSTAHEHGFSVKREDGETFLYMLAGS